MINQPANDRRFVVIETGIIVAIFDQCRAYTTYAPLCNANELDLSAARTYWPDEVEELA